MAVQRLAASVLRRLGYTVLEANSAQEVEQRYLPALPSVDLLVTDIVMPGMNGEALAESLQQKKPDLPVLLMSGFVRDGVASHLISHDRVHFLHKPFSPDELAAYVRDALDSNNDQKPQTD
ncbi:MAG: response regulator [Pirellulaceae bacterium]